ncbi:trimethylamine methyltransferase family protein [Alphaproteobacteria bacterium]|jgi:trimethylamine---corrinoid protein Co-methyltransferase|nr:trimethylamine methyltransferase family protein [Alphaproteobacteria bacterium]
MSEQRASRRSGRNRHKQTESSVGPITKGVEGGLLRPLTQQDMLKIDQAVWQILQEIGLSEAPSIVTNAVIEAGGALSEDGRLTYSSELIRNALAGFKKSFVLHGQKSGHELELSGSKVHMGTGGAAPLILDLETRTYRETRLQDLYDCARLVDGLEHIHFFSRTLTARELDSAKALDINTAYASLRGTSKHVCTQITEAGNVQDIAEMCYMIAGSKEAFLEKPFLSVNVNHAVPPLRFDSQSCEVMAEAVRYGLPVHCNVYSQVGASTPVSLAGAIAQTTAEALAGMIFAWLIDPDATIIFGGRPMIVDMRTGAVSGGSGEQALYMAACSQMAQYYDLPNSTIAGATDSKIADAQSGYEKCLAVANVAQAGCNMITQSCGMQANLMGVALEAFVIDNDMLGGILRTLAKPQVDTQTLSVDVIADVVRGEGHFLGHPDTYKRMRSDFLYPETADRRSIEDWEADGAMNIRQKALIATKEMLATSYPSHISDELDVQLRECFDIALPKQATNAA